jgi:hypothetical protein
MIETPVFKITKDRFGKNIYIWENPPGTDAEFSAEELSWLSTQLKLVAKGYNPLMKGLKR